MGGASSANSHGDFQVILDHPQSSTGSQESLKTEKYLELFQAFPITVVGLILISYSMC